MSEAELILPNMRGGCVRVGNKVHTLFRLTTIAPRQHATIEERAGPALSIAAPRAKRQGERTLPAAYG